MDGLFLQIINMSITSSYVILFIILIRILLKKAPKIFSYGLWSVALLRLTVPFSFKSIFSLIPINTKTIPSDIIYSEIPQINSGITVIDRAVNNSLPAPTLAASVNPMQIWIGIGQIIWIIGLIVLIIYSLVTTIRLSKKLKLAIHISDNIYETNTFKTPFVFGLIKPKVYLPINLSESEKSYIIKHEQTHIKRYDHIIKFIAFMVVSIHWFNPLVWIAFLLMGKDMELSCDERVIRELGNGIKKDYSNSLLSLSTGRRIIGGSPLAFGENNTKGRIKNILNYKKPRFWITLVGIIVIVVASVGLLSNPKGKVDFGIWPEGTWQGIVMANGKLYVYTGDKISSKIDKGEIIGKIRSTIIPYEIPTEEGQANFEIKGSKYAKYKEDIAVLIDKEWILFIDKEIQDMSFSIGNYGFLMKSLSDDEVNKLLGRITLEIRKDRDYKNNRDAIIEKSFKACGIEDPLLIDEAKSRFEITVDKVLINSEEETKLDSTEGNKVVSEYFAKDLLNQLEKQDFTIMGENLDDKDDETIISFGKAFVNLYNGAVVEQRRVSFEKYIGNVNLIKFTDKILELTQKQELQGGHGVIYGLKNEFIQSKLYHMEDNLCYLELLFEFEGSGMGLKMLITTENKSLKLVDLYFGNKDGVDTLTTGHPAERKINDPKLWENEEWVKGVFDKLKHFEEKL